MQIMVHRIEILESVKHSLDGYALPILELQNVFQVLHSDSPAKFPKIFITRVIYDYILEILQENCSVICKMCSTYYIVIRGTHFAILAYPQVLVYNSLQEVQNVSERFCCSLCIALRF